MQAVVMMIIGAPLTLVAAEFSPNLWVFLPCFFTGVGLAAAIAARVAPERW